MLDSWVYDVCGDGPHACGLRYDEMRRDDPKRYRADEQRGAYGDARDEVGGDAFYT